MTPQDAQPPPPIDGDDPSPDDFAVKDCALIAIATGKKAHTARELLDTLGTIDSACIYHHFWGGLLEPRFEEREFNNDFAAWARHGLHDGGLAERLAVVDPTEHPSLEDLRQTLIDILEERLDESEYLHWMRATQQFSFIRSQIVVFDTDRRVSSAAEMAELMPQLSPSSIFYHFIDGRRRPPERLDDFSSWLADMGHDQLVVALAGIDPYFGSLTELRHRLSEAFNEFV